MNRPKKQLSVLESVETLTDQELREGLKKYGVSPGPITDSTRNLYRRKLVSMIEAAPDVTSNSIRFSRTNHQVRTIELDEDSDTSDEDFKIEDEDLTEDETSGGEESDYEEEDEDENEMLDELGDIRLSSTTSGHERLASSAISYTDSAPNKTSKSLMVFVAVMFVGIIFSYLYTSNSKLILASFAQLKSASRMVPFMIFATPIIYVLYKLFFYFRLRSHEDRRRLCSLVDEVLELLQSPDNPKGSMPVLHIRDTLLSPTERKAKRVMNTWSKVVKLIENDSRVKSEMVRIDGEDFRAWKWIGSRNL